jgi:hypothetical protein
MFQQLILFLHSHQALIVTFNTSLAEEGMHEAFGADPIPVGIVASNAKLDKCEERLIAAKSRQDAAYNRSAATVESKNETVASFAKASSAHHAYVDAGKLKKRRGTTSL